MLSSPGRPTASRSSRSTAGLCVSSFPHATSGRAPSGCGPSSCCRPTNPASGSATATTTTPTTGRKSGTNFDCRIPPFEGEGGSAKEPISHANHLPLIPLAKRPSPGRFAVQGSICASGKTKAGLRRPSKSSERATRLHHVHSAHAARHAGTSASLLRGLGDDRLGGEDVLRNRRCVLKRRANHHRRVGDPGLDEILVLIRLDVEPEPLRRVPDLVDDDRTLETRVVRQLANGLLERADDNRCACALVPFVVVE